MSPSRPIYRAYLLAMTAVANGGSMHSHCPRSLYDVRVGSQNDPFWAEALYWTWPMKRRSVFSFYLWPLIFMVEQIVTSSMALAFQCVFDRYRIDGQRLTSFHMRDISSYEVACSGIIDIEWLTAWVACTTHLTSPFACSTFNRFRGHLIPRQPTSSSCAIHQGRSTPELGHPSLLSLGSDFIALNVILDDLDREAVFGYIVPIWVAIPVAVGAAIYRMKQLGAWLLSPFAYIETLAVWPEMDVDVPVPHTLRYTKTTPPDTIFSTFFNGLNLLGKVLMDVRDMVRA